MDEARLTQALTGLVGETLAAGLVSDFVKTRQSHTNKTLQRASSGKFVETFVKCLQQISTGKHDTKPSVDSYLHTKVENDTALPEGLRFCGGRIARAMYTLRKKPDIARKSEVGPNTLDLALIHVGATWIMAEMIRCTSGVTTEDAGAVIELVQAPAGTLVEEIDGTRLNQAEVSTRTGILIVLHGRYPDRVGMPDILKAMSDRSPESVRSRLSELRVAKLVFGGGETGYRLTAAGHQAATAAIEALQVRKAR